MSGIVGAFDLRDRRDFSNERLEVMGRALAHRGPDGQDVHLEPGFALAIRRLAVFEPPRSRQPAANEDRCAWAAIDGELHPDDQLSEELAARGHRLVGHGDAETLVHLYEEAGEQFVDRIRGNYAVVLWDSTRRKLILARDRLGVIPLFYAERDGWLLWASEIKALFASGLVAAEADPRGIDDIFTCFASNTTRTAFQGISAITPGHYLRVAERSVERVKYWDLDFPDAGRESRPVDPLVLVDQLEHLLRRSVRRRLHGGPPPAVYLSGGLDSTLVLALAAQERGAPVPAFTLDLASSGSDERSKAEQSAAALGCPLHALPVAPREIAEAYPALICAFECPDTVTSDAGMILLGAAVRRHGFHSVLGGDGADTFLGGEEYKSQRLHARFNWHLSRLGYWLAGGGLALRDAGGRPARTPFRAFRGQRGKRQLAFEISGRFREALYTPRMWDALRGHSPLADLELTNERFLRWHPINQAVYVEYRGFIPGIVLPAADRAGMQSSIRVRTPFVDSDLLDFSSSIDPEISVCPKEGKWLLRQLAERVLPHELAQRPKQGLFVNLSSTFLGADRPPWVDQLLSPESLRATDYFHPAAVARLRARHQRGIRRPLVRVSTDVALTMVIATQLWHHIFLGGGLADLAHGGQGAIGPLHDHI